ncbi:hypothetical protein M8R20_15530 [Pseudomonas sp. R2.Fl]|nr:hypothetical protein [Pseudomonas sp. R2.Fl]
MRHQRIAIGRKITDCISGRRHRFQYLDGTGRRIEPDAVAEAAVPVRIVGHDQRHPPVFRSPAPQLRPPAGEFGDEPRPADIRLVADDIRLHSLVEPRRRLE